jgi:hypothetical protein
MSDDMLKTTDKVYVNRDALKRSSGRLRAGLMLQSVHRAKRVGMGVLHNTVYRQLMFLQ